MIVEKIINEDGTVVYILKKHKKEIYRCAIPRDAVHYKTALVTKFQQKKNENPNSIPFTEKEFLSALCKIDEQFESHYITKYWAGGKRPNAGRKKGSKNNKPKTKRTERLNMSLTAEEKELLIDILKKYRLNQS